MKKEELLKACRYYKGEERCPLDGSVEFWWRMEAYAVQNGEQMSETLLSPVVCAHIRELHYEAAQHDTTWQECLARCVKLYKLGRWSSGYVCSKDAPLPQY